MFEDTPLLLSIIASLIFCAVLGSYLWQTSTSNFKAGRKLPPGPPRLPFIGSLLHLPKDHEWLAYEKWGKEYDSDIIHFDVLGSHMIVVNSAKAATELFEKRSAIYSDRPSFSALTKLIGFDWTLVFSPYGDRFRAFRKGFHTFLGPESVTEYRPLERRSIHRLLRNLVEKPEDFMGHLRHMAGAIILSIAFGIDVKAEHDPHVEIAERGLQAVTAGSTAGAALFDFFPFLLRMPSWFPGAGLKTEAKNIRRWAKAMVEDPYNATAQAMANGRATASVASAMMAHIEAEPGLTDKDVTIARQLPANMYLGGADTTVCALDIFFLAMTLYPEAQKKAQAEIDSVIGQDRLPTFADESSLPYIDAVVKEVLRWRNVAPLGVFHRLTTDDIYEDHFLPAGSTVIGNVWAILHDENVFPDPMSFKPERFLEPGAEYPDMAFGFGRRICPGMYLAKESVWFAVVSVLATLDITKAVDSDTGKEIEPVDDCLSGIVGYPFPFECTIKPRSSAAERLIQLTASEVDD